VGAKPKGVTKGIKELTEPGSPEEETLTHFDLGSRQHVFVPDLGSALCKACPFCVTGARQSVFSTRDGVAGRSKMPGLGAF